MILPDVNVLVYAHRIESPEHERYREWLHENTAGPEPFALCDLVLSGFIRVVTHSRICKEPTTPAVAFQFVRELRSSRYATVVSPGPRHWEIFENLCLKVKARGSLVADAYHAALAIETGSEWITADRDFARFPGLRWRHPLD